MLNIDHQADTLKTTVNTSEMVQLEQLSELQDFVCSQYFEVHGKKMLNSHSQKHNKMCCLAHSNEKEVMDGSYNINYNSDMLHTHYLQIFFSIKGNS